MPLCPRPGFPLGGIRLVVEDPCLLDRVCLCPRTGCTCWCRTLLTGGMVLFGCLTPGDYVLTLTRRDRRVPFRVALPPGGNVVLHCSLGAGRWSWRQDPFHYFFNAR